jgi:hypothetical protein
MQEGSYRPRVKEPDHINHCAMKLALLDDVRSSVLKKAGQDHGLAIKVGSWCDEAEGSR